MHNYTPLPGPPGPPGPPGAPGAVVHHHHYGPPPAPPPSVVYVPQTPGPEPGAVVRHVPPEPEPLQTHRHVIEGMRHAAAHFQEMQNQAMRTEQERIALAVAQEQAHRQRHAEVSQLLGALRNPGLTVYQQMQQHLNVFNNRTLTQQVFTNNPQRLGLPTPSAPTLDDDEMVQAVSKRPGDEGGGGGSKRLKAIADRPAQVVANETAKRLVALANAAHAASAAEQPSPADAAAMAVGHMPYGPGFKPPVRLAKLAPYTKTLGQERAAQAAREVARELMAKMTPGKKRPSEAAATAAAAEADNDQSGGKPKLGKFAKSVAKAAKARAARPTPGRAQAVQAFEEAKAKAPKPAPKAPRAEKETPRKVIRSISKTPRSAKVK